MVPYQEMLDVIKATFPDTERLQDKPNDTSKVGHVAQSILHIKVRPVVLGTPHINVGLVALGKPHINVGPVAFFTLHVKEGQLH